MNSNSEQRNEGEWVLIERRDLVTLLHEATSGGVIPDIAQKAFDRCTTLDHSQSSRIADWFSDE